MYIYIHIYYVCVCVCFYGKTYCRVLSPPNNSDCKRKTTMKWKSSNPEYNEQVQQKDQNCARVWLEMD